MTRRVSWLTVFASVLLGLASVRTAGAQVPPAPPQVELVATDYDGGRVIASLRTPNDDGLSVANITALVDGTPRSVEPVSTEGKQPVSLVLVIDTSGSMDGAPIAAARAAAASLVDRMAPIDRVAVVAFADGEQVLPFTNDRNSARTVISHLQAKGGTQLYEAVKRGTAMLAQAPAGPRILVLLSDGEDDAAGSPARAASIAAARANGIRIYSFGLGTAIDAAYLSELSQATSGMFSQVTDERALGGVFLNLRDQIGRTLGFNIAVPALAAGDHTITLRARVAGKDVTISRPLRVVDEGTLRARTPPKADGANPMVVDVEWALPQGPLQLQATADGKQLPVLTAPDRVVVDPWQFAPGDLDVFMLATSNGVGVARGTTRVSVPALQPLLTLRRDGKTSSAVYVAQGRVQDDDHSTIVALVDNKEVSRSQNGELRLPVRGGRTLVVRLEDAGGALMATQSVTAPRGLQLTRPLLVLIPTLLVCIALWRIVSARMRAHAAQEAGLLLRSRRRTLLAETPMSPLERGTLVVQGPDGVERRYAIGPRPLSLGRSPDCDVVLDSDEVWDLHARLSALKSGEFQVHGIAPPTISFGDGSRDEWTVVRAGEQIAIGGHVLTVLVPGTPAPTVPVLDEEPAGSKVLV